MPNLAIGIQTISRDDLERARARGKRVNTYGIGWVHISRKVPRELADAALGRVFVIGGRSGVRRLQDR